MLYPSGFKTYLDQLNVMVIKKIPNSFETKLQTVYILFCDNDDDYTIGEHTAPNGKIAFDCIQQATHHLLDHSADALVTAPISKLSLKWAGLNFTGHTTCLAQLTGTSHVSMAFSSPELNVLLHTIHIPLEEVPKYINPTRLRQSVDSAIKFGKLCGYDAPRVAISSLNPHAGERGKLGFEDTELITPLVKEYVDKGYLVSGPHPADTVFGTQGNNTMMLL